MSLRVSTVLVAAFVSNGGCMLMDQGTGVPDDTVGGGGGGGVPTNPPRSGVSLKEIATGLTSPVALVDPDDGTDRLFVVDQVGPIRVLEDQVLMPEPFLDLTDRIVPIDPTYDERGVLGLAFHPDFESNGRFFVYYSAPLRMHAPDGYDHTNVLSEFEVDRSGVCDITTEKILLQIDHPSMNHNGGTLMFGPDGMLYLSVGDGGNKNDVGLGHPPIGNGQDPDTLLGKVLRLDVSGPEMMIPEDNPYAAMGKNPGGGDEEIWALGFRNPYRFSFDRRSGALWLADLGQNLMEEIDIVHRGGNYGWNVKEGFLCFNPADEWDPLASCPDVGPQGDLLMDPFLAYLHPPMREGGMNFDPASIPEAQGFPQLGLGAIGGFVYRGDMLPEHDGHYILGDIASSIDMPSGKLIMAMRRANSWVLEPMKLDRVPGRMMEEGMTPETRPMYERGRIPWFVLGLGEDRDGELYVLVNKTLAPMGTTGRVFALVPTDSLE